MAGSLRVQLIGFTAAVLLVASLIGWTGWLAWQHIAYLRGAYEEVDIESFQFAEHVLAAVRGLNESLKAFETDALPAQREEFLTNGVALREWIAAKTPHAQTETERQLMRRIGAEFSNYLAVASQQLEARSHLLDAAPDALSGEVRQGYRRILRLCEELAAAHKEALKQLVKASERRMAQLQHLMLAGATLLLLFGGTIAAFVYRGTIAPLRMQLVESRAIIERQEKLSSLGLLAAGVAHEIRNPLTAIKVRLHSLRRALTDHPSALEDATLLGQEIGRLERIVNDILQFARPADPVWAEVTAASLLQEVHALLQPELAGRSLQFILGPVAPGRVRVDPQQMRQVLINLIRNAAESMPGPGTVTLRARAATRTLDGRPTPVMILEVSDTGPGIPPEVQKRLFDPFFTTKEGGTGLGLAIAARIVQKHGGALCYQTHPRQGTTFGVVLPRLPDHETDHPADRR